MRRLIALFALAAMVQVPASAQLAPGVSGFSSAPTTASEAEYWQMIRRLGGCLAASKHDQSVAFLAAAPGSANEDEAFDALFHSQRNRCMGNFVSASMLRGHVRGSVAEGLLKRMPASALDRVVSAPPASPAIVNSIYDFAECYVAEHPATARQFLDDTSVGTRGEVQAIRQMAPDFGVCFPEGVEVSINPINIRMAIAEAYYKAASLPAPSSVEGPE